MTEDTQCETMGLQATMLTNPLERFIPPSPPPSLKRKPTEEILSPGSTGLVVDPPKKLCLEVLKDASSRVEEALQNILDEDNKENQSRAKVILPAATKENASASAVAMTPTEVPKVIVQHSPLPSIYELEQMASLPVPPSPISLDSETIPTPPLSDDSASDESEEDDFSPPPRTYPQTLEQRYWGPQIGVNNNNNNNTLNNNNKRVGTPALGIHHQVVPSPPPSPFGFLEQNDQRIECAENGKSYLQLGTMNHQHHHIPVTPVIQPKSSPSSYYQHHARRPGIRPHPMLPRPLCDHSNCLQRRSSLCYRNHRTRMLNVSLHKLHLARQNHEGSLRRSVLICNMLRHIEEEAEKEQVEQSTTFNNNHLPPPSGTGEELYSWSGSNEVISSYGHQQQPPSSSPPQNQVSQPPPPQQQQQPGTNPPFPGQTSPPYDTYEMTLKDFNSAFRSTPYGSPAHPGIESGGETHHLLEEGNGESINWSSVLNLSSGSALDPSYGSSGGGGASPSSSSWSSGASSNTSNNSSSGTPPRNNTTTNNNSSTTNTNNNSSPSNNNNINCKSDEGFEDIGWKLSAEDVLKAFPNDEHIFVGP